ncbi:lysoplasmalogenase TMEM86A-like [Lytechinus pictus]|uniref:lysoplasmalogenase TMEM86A-like n=1 Tax=Lytechinus pictus TaxID=7653 RepID=UPI0030B9B279
MADYGRSVLTYTIFSAIYVVFRPEPSWVAIIFKTLPILCLGLLVVDTIRHATHQPKTHYDVSILIGLILSGFGDAFLVYNYDPDFFILGLLHFAMAHASYIVAFGLRPFNAKLFAVSAICGCGVYSVLGSGFTRHNLTGLGILYTTLIMSMCWRALARPPLPGNQETWTWSAVGAILFFISDFVLGINKFRAPVPYANTIIMVTYYAGQLGIALSVFGRGDQLRND